MGLPLSVGEAMEWGLVRTGEGAYLPLPLLTLSHRVALAHIVLKGSHTLALPRLRRTPLLLPPLLLLPPRVRRQPRLPHALLSCTRPLLCSAAGGADRRVAAAAVAAILLKAATATHREAATKAAAAHVAIATRQDTRLGRRRPVVV